MDEIDERVSNLYEVLVSHDRLINSMAETEDVKAMLKDFQSQLEIKVNTMVIDNMTALRKELDLKQDKGSW